MKVCGNPALSKSIWHHLSNSICSLDVSVTVWLFPQYFKLLHHSHTYYGDLWSSTLLLQLIEGQEDTLAKGMETQPSIFAWRTPWKEEPGGLWDHRESNTTEWLTTPQIQIEWVEWGSMTSYNLLQKAPGDPFTPPAMNSQSHLRWVWVRREDV